MNCGRFTRVTGILMACVILAGCGDRGLFGSRTPQDQEARAERIAQQRANSPIGIAERERRESNTSTIWDLFRNDADPNVTLEVNKYIWRASLDVLNFLPIQSVDPFSGVITTGYGTPPGGGRAYRAVIYVQDAALDARSLKLALATRSGPVSPDTVRAVEDAILTRARQLRIADKDL